MIPTFIGITAVCFALTRFLPGGPVEMRLMRARGVGAAGVAANAAVATSGVTKEYKEELERQFGFD